MSNIVNLLYEKFVRPYLFIITVIVSIVLFIWGAHYVFTNFKNQKKSSADVVNTGGDDVGTAIQIYLFHVDWCPHCKTALPQWKLFADMWDGKQLNGHVISCVEVNCTDNDSPRIKKYLDDYNIDSFPTVKAVIGEKVVDFDAKVTHKNLEAFAKSVGSSSM